MYDFFEFLKVYLIKEIEDIFLASIEFIETLVEIWKKLKTAWKHSHFVLVFPHNFSFVPNFHACFYLRWSNTKYF